MSAGRTALVFLHGWGQSSKVWFSQSLRFSQEYDVRLLDLPGHGGVPEAAAGEWLGRLIGQCPERPFTLVGWSLGGQLAMQLALQYPRRVRALVLVSATPCFCRQDGWIHGCDEALFDGFKQGVSTKSLRVMSRFFTLMLQGEALSRQLFNRLARAAVDRAHPPTRQALTAGLEILGSMDLRAELHKLQLPCLILHGEDDRVVPVAAGQVLAVGIDSARLFTFPACGHAPFLTQAGNFNRIMEAWCKNPEFINAL